MEPTLDVGQRVLVSRVNYRFSDPDRGDIVVFHPPEGAESNECGAEPRRRPGLPAAAFASESDVNFIKRIVAVPGDTLSMRERARGRQRQGPTEPTTSGPASPGSCDFPRPIKVPPGHFFMMGDNRGASDDSRFWGPVPEEWIIGQAFFTYWPVRTGSASSNGTEPQAPAHGAAAVLLRPRPSSAGSSPAPTRPGAGASPGRWWPPRCCSTTSA